MERNHGIMGLSTRTACVMVTAGGLFLYGAMRGYDASRSGGWEWLWWVLVLAGMGALSAVVVRWQVVGPIVDLARRSSVNLETSDREPMHHLPAELELLDLAMRGALRSARLSSEERVEAERAFQSLAGTVKGHWQTLREKAQLQSKVLEDAQAELRVMEDRLRQAMEEMEDLSGHSDRAERGSEQAGRMLVESSGVSRKIAALSAGLVARGQEMLDTLDAMDAEAKAFERMAQSASGTVARAADMAKGMTSSSGELARSTAELNRIASEGGQVVKEVNSCSRDTSQAVLENASIIRDLGSRSEEIGAVVEVIESIADETNLLALNAAIIAAQAGEHGKSFAVVADEIRELAERTSSSTKEVADLVKGVQDGIGRATWSIEQSAEKVQQSANLAEQAGVIWESVRSTSETNVKLADSITLSCSEQSQGTDSLGQAVESIAGAVERAQKRVRDQRGIQDRTSQDLCSLKGLADDWGETVTRAAELADLLDKETHSATALLRRIMDSCTQGNQLAGQARGRIHESRDLTLGQIEVLQEQGGVLRASEAQRATRKDGTAEERVLIPEVACE